MKFGFHAEVLRRMVTHVECRVDVGLSGVGPEYTTLALM